MNATKKLIFALTAGAALVVATPVFADQGRGRDHDYYRGRGAYTNYDRHEYRERFRADDRRVYRNRFRDFDRRRFFVAQQPIFVAQQPMMVEPPVYYAQPAPMRDIIGPAALIGAVIGGYIDSRQ